MEARYAIRKRQLLDECQVSPEIFEHVIPRLYSFMKPFVTIFQGQGGDQHAKTSVCGLLSNLERKNVASIASRFDHSRLPLQAFIGWEEWDDEPLRLALRHQVKTHVGQGDGVLVFAPSGFPKSGRQSVGVARQWCGRLGQVDNCQVAMYLGYVSSKGHTLVDQRLLLPKEWTKDKARLDKAGVPKASRASRTRHQLALEMLAKNGAGLPHGWMSGDDERGPTVWVSASTGHLGVSAPCWRYRRTRPCVLWKPSPWSIAVRVVGPGLPGKALRPGVNRCGEEAWHSIDVRDGSKGPLVVEAVKRRMLSRTHRRQPGDEEMLVVLRYRDRDQQEVVTVDYSLSNAMPETPVWECARVAKAEHRIEECMQRSKSEAGLADYEVRTLDGLAAASNAFVTGHVVSGTRNRTGKKMDPCDDLTADSPGHRDDCARGVSVRHHAAYAQGAPEATATQ